MAKRALITGASSGIGRDMAKVLASKGYDLVIVARSEDKLQELKSEINTNVEIIVMDLSIKENCIELFNKVGYVDILVNNAGFGIFGKFSETDLQRELELINTNVVAVHILTKLFLQEMVKKDSGYILNVSSIAGHLPGPLMDAYYASKSYVYVLSTSINEELRKDRANVKVGTLNPGPVRTNFNNVANVKFSMHSLTSEYVAKYTVEKMLKGKVDITPGLDIKFLRFAAKIVPDNLMAKMVHVRQTRKRK